MKKLLLTLVLGISMVLGLSAQIVPPMTGQVINTKVVDPTHLQIRFRSNTGYTFSSIEAGDIYAVKSGANIIRYYISSTSTAGFHPGFDGTIAITPLDGYTGTIPTATPTASGYIYRPIGGIAPLEYQNQDYLNWAMVNWNLQSLRDSIGAGGGSVNTIYTASDSIRDTIRLVQMGGDQQLGIGKWPLGFGNYNQYDDESVGFYVSAMTGNYGTGMTTYSEDHKHNLESYTNDFGFYTNPKTGFSGVSSMGFNMYNNGRLVHTNHFLIGKESSKQGGSYNYIGTGSGQDSMFFGMFKGVGNTLLSNGIRRGGASFGIWDLKAQDTSFQYSISKNVLGTTTDYLSVKPWVTNSIELYDKYTLPNAIPSTANLTKSIMTWTGNGSTTTPAFEVQPKKYVALLTQTGTSAPVATVLMNTTGATITWTRDIAGAYTGTASSAIFTTNKTVPGNVMVEPYAPRYVLTEVGNGTGGYVSYGGVGDNLTIAVIVMNEAEVPTDGLLYSFPIEVTIYP